ncbi:MAG: translation initiation factor IF-2 [Rickettsiaceae bacterium]|nr:translation initiation factor IF-2 [Rickettsiaceae bacterium]
MNENNNSENPDNPLTPKKERKTLTAGTLSLNRPNNLEFANKSLVGAKNSKGLKSTVAVEVKRNAGVLTDNIFSVSNIKDKDMEERIKLLQKAFTQAEEKKHEEALNLSKQQELALDDKTSQTAVEEISKPSQDIDTNNLDVQQSSSSSAQPVKPEPTKTEKETIDTKKAEVKKDNNEKPYAKNVTKAPDKNNFKSQVATAKTTDNEEATDSKKPANKALASVKSKQPILKNFNKSHLYKLAEGGDDESANFGRNRSLAAIKRSKEKEKRKLEAQNQQREKIYKEVVVSDMISVGELASQMSERVADVIKELMKLGVIANSTQFVDADVAELVITSLGHSCKRLETVDIDTLIAKEVAIQDSSTLTQRPPVVTVMGHVDHGKTSLLDSLKSSNVVENESGGITQHIGAYQIKVSEQDKITFIDTPGHEAFASIRSRGAKVTDIVILVVAADDGVKPQTIEAIKHAKAENLPIIVAINKIDKPSANPDRIEEELLSHDIVSEKFGGDVVMVPISATKRLNLDLLIEAILIVAAGIPSLKASFGSDASGVVLETRLVKNSGMTCTFLVQNGTLKIGDFLVAGGTCCRVKLLKDYTGAEISEANPSMPVEVWGFDELPHSGDRFAVTTEKRARMIAENFAENFREKRIAKAHKGGLNELLLQSGKNLKELILIIKADTQGSIEAINYSLNKIVSDEVKLRIVNSAVGEIKESDISLASTINAMILGFNVKANSGAAEMANTKGVKISLYSIIYNLVDQVKEIMGEMLTPISIEEFLGTAEVRQIFDIGKVGKIAGCYVTKGLIKRNAKARVLRNSKVVAEGVVKTLRRFKDDAKEVKENYECGIAVNNYDNMELHDIIECFEVVQQKRKID